MIVDNSQFKDSEAMRGGSFYNVDTDFIVSRSRFSHNTATISGGAFEARHVRLSLVSTILITDSDGFSCSAKDTGGFLFLETSYAIISFSACVNCDAAIGSSFTAVDAGLISFEFARCMASTVQSCHFFWGEGVFVDESYCLFSINQPRCDTHDIMLSGVEPAFSSKKRTFHFESRTQAEDFQFISVKSTDFAEIDFSSVLIDSYHSFTFFPNAEYAPTCTFLSVCAQFASAIASFEQKTPTRPIVFFVNLGDYYMKASHVINITLEVKPAMPLTSIYQTDSFLMSIMNSTVTVLNIRMYCGIETAFICLHDAKLFFKRTSFHKAEHFGASSLPVITCTNATAVAFSGTEFLSVFERPFTTGSFDLLVMENVKFRNKHFLLYATFDVSSNTSTINLLDLIFDCVQFDGHLIIFDGGCHLTMRNIMFTEVDSADPLVLCYTTSVVIILDQVEFRLPSTFLSIHSLDGVPVMCEMSISDGMIVHHGMIEVPFIIIDTDLHLLSRFSSTRLTSSTSSPLVLHEPTARELMHHTSRDTSYCSSFGVHTISCGSIETPCQTLPFAFGQSSCFAAFTVTILTHFSLDPTLISNRTVTMNSSDPSIILSPSPQLEGSLIVVARSKLTVEDCKFVNTPPTLLHPLFLFIQSDGILSSCDFQCDLRQDQNSLITMNGYETSLQLSHCRYYFFPHHSQITRPLVHLTNSTKFALFDLTVENYNDDGHIFNVQMVPEKDVHMERAILHKCSTNASSLLEVILPPKSSCTVNNSIIHSCRCGDSQTGILHIILSKDAVLTVVNAAFGDIETNALVCLSVTSFAYIKSQVEIAIHEMISPTLIVAKKGSVSMSILPLITSVKLDFKISEGGVDSTNCLQSESIACRTLDYLLLCMSSEQLEIRRTATLYRSSDTLTRRYVVACLFTLKSDSNLATLIFASDRDVSIELRSGGTFHQITFMVFQTQRSPMLVFTGDTVFLDQCRVTSTPNQLLTTSNPLISSKNTFVYFMNCVLKDSITYNHPLLDVRGGDVSILSSSISDVIFSPYSPSGLFNFSCSSVYVTALTFTKYQVSSGALLFVHEAETIVRLSYITLAGGYYSETGACGLKINSPDSIFISYIDLSDQTMSRNIEANAMSITSDNDVNFVSLTIKQCDMFADYSSTIQVELRNDAQLSLTNVSIESLIAPTPIVQLMLISPSLDRTRQALLDTLSSSSVYPSDIQHRKDFASPPRPLFSYNNTNTVFMIKESGKDQMDCGEIFKPCKTIDYVLNVFPRRQHHICIFSPNSFTPLDTRYESLIILAAKPELLTLSSSSLVVSFLSCDNLDLSNLILAVCPNDATASPIVSIFSTLRLGRVTFTLSDPSSVIHTYIRLVTATAWFDDVVVTHDILRDAPFVVCDSSVIFINRLVVETQADTPSLFVLMGSSSLHTVSLVVNNLHMAIDSSLIQSNGILDKAELSFNNSQFVTIESITVPAIFALSLSFSVFELHSCSFNGITTSNPNPVGVSSIIGTLNLFQSSLIMNTTTVSPPSLQSVIPYSWNVSMNLSRIALINTSFTPSPDVVSKSIIIYHKYLNAPMSNISHSTSYFGADPSSAVVVNKNGEMMTLSAAQRLHTSRVWSTTISIFAASLVLLSIVLFFVSFSVSQYVRKNPPSKESILAGLRGDGGQNVQPEFDVIRIQDSGIVYDSVSVGNVVSNAVHSSNHRLNRSFRQQRTHWWEEDSDSEGVFIDSDSDI